MGQRFSRVLFRPRNSRKMRQNFSPRLVLNKHGPKVSSFRWSRKRSKFRGIPRHVLEMAEKKGKTPRLVLDLEKILLQVSSSTLSSLEEPLRNSVKGPQVWGKISYEGSTGVKGPKVHQQQSFPSCTQPIRVYLRRSKTVKNNYIRTFLKPFG